MDKEIIIFSQRCSTKPEAEELLEYMKMLAGSREIYATIKEGYYSVDHKWFEASVTLSTED